ncbi:unnamed protein product [Protopolystoma xenopodis]|uniref:Uncharacterized protein n=1 Tax=Protopolystoma xenopodis TaxID=117903 RepID=A0A3S5A2S5_9PLAT|nr:unnamed protein product [Protopolystoma xenopodis]
MMGESFVWSHRGRRMVGEPLLFNAVLAGKESRAKWRATQVWKESDQVAGHLLASAIQRNMPGSSESLAGFMRQGVSSAGEYSATSTSAGKVNLAAHLNGISTGGFQLPQTTCCHGNPLWPSQGTTNSPIPLGEGLNDDILGQSATNMVNGGDNDSTNRLLGPAVSIGQGLSGDGNGVHTSRSDADELRLLLLDAGLAGVDSEELCSAFASVRLAEAWEINNFALQAAQANMTTAVEPSGSSLMKKSPINTTSTMLAQTELGFQGVVPKQTSTMAEKPIATFQLDQFDIRNLEHGKT